MEIKIEKDILQQIIEAIKKLPVKCEDFNSADRWVGIIMVLESFLEQTPETQETLAEGE